MKLLLLTIDFPLPVNAGGVVRLLGISEALARKGHDITMLARLRESDTDPALVPALSQRLGGAQVEVFGAPQRPAPGGAARVAGRWAWSIGTRTPPWVWTAYSREMAARAKELAGDFDACLILDDNAHQYAVDLKGKVPVVLDMQNVMAASWNNTNHWGGAEPTAAQKAQQALAYRLLVQWEHRVSHAADAVIVTSADESVRFKEHHGMDCDWVGSAIGTPELVASPRQAKPNVVWLGDHRYHANVHGLLRFLREGWRPLGERGMTLQIVGREPGEEVLALANELPGVDILGFVEDLDGLLASAAAAVVPVWKGAGIKMKTLVLMGAGLPVASTSVGMEGIAAQDGVDARLADDPVELATAVGDLITDREAGAALGLRGRERILAEHTWDGVIDQVEAVLQRVAR
ncbi:MAG: glycosyltransferase [Solirubrobacteraceae bacterium]|nr:glycosyltransferase [Solirubrobacteraceae bacterium]